MTLTARQLAELSPSTLNNGLARFAEFATSSDMDPRLVGADFKEMFRQGILTEDSRGKQKEIGPSEYAHPCDRWLGYKLAGIKGFGDQVTPWRQWVGTQIHNGGDRHAERWNEQYGPTWLTNLYVRIGELYPGYEVWGTLDFLHVPSATVVDLKCPGTTAMRTYAPGKPEAEQYRGQINGYAAGVTAAGFPVKWVATMRLSPGAELVKGIYKFERFDPEYVTDRLARCGTIARKVDLLGPNAVYDLNPTEANCHRCQYYVPRAPSGVNDLTQGCPGHPDMRAPDGKRADGTLKPDPLVA